MGDPALLAAKLREETEELIQALQNVDGGSGSLDGDDAGSGPSGGDDVGTNGSTGPAREQANEVIHEAADLLYFTLVAAASHGVGVGALRQELAQRSLRVRRRPMAAKPDEGKPDEGGDR